MKPGFYRIAKTVKNPRPDRRSDTFGTAVDWKEGTEIVLTYPDRENGEAQYAAAIGIGYRDYAREIRANHDGWEVLCEALVLEPNPSGIARVAFQRYVPNFAWLLDNGWITPKQLTAWCDAYAEDDPE